MPDSTDTATEAPALRRGFRYWTGDAARALSDDERRAEAFASYVENSAPYNDAVVAAGEQTWHQGNLGRRAALYYRRWTRPAPPVGLTLDLNVIRRRENIITDQHRAYPDNTHQELAA